jgi:hypothetical protein
VAIGRCAATGLIRRLNHTLLGTQDLAHWICRAGCVAPDVSRWPRDAQHAPMLGEVAQGQRGDWHLDDRN